MPASSSPTVVLVHGAFADASGFAGVIRELQSAGITVQAPPNPLRSVAGDAATVGAAVAAIDGPVLLVGHCLRRRRDHPGRRRPGQRGRPGLPGGVRPRPRRERRQRAGAFALPLLAKNARPTPYEALGAAGGPDLYIDSATFRETFCADLPADLAAVMAATPAAGRRRDAEREVHLGRLEDQADLLPDLRAGPSHQPGCGTVHG